LIFCLDVDKSAKARSAETTVGSGVNGADEQTEFKGTVRKSTAYKGTLSEYSYFVLVTDDGKQMVLFNQKKRSLGFDEYKDRDVIVKGHMGVGTIGWRKQKKQGLLVDSIRYAR